MFGNNLIHSNSIQLILLIFSRLPKYVFVFWKYKKKKKQKQKQRKTKKKKISNFWKSEGRKKKE